MIAIHMVHRRLAEIQMQVHKLGSYELLPLSVQVELWHCMILNAELVQKMDALKQLSQLAFEMNDVDWQHEICGKIDQLEAGCV